MSTVDAPYSVRTLRMMREKRKPSERLSKRISETYDYFLERVDPIVGACVTYLLSEQPADIAASMIEYLKARQENIILTPSAANDRPRRELKVFLAIHIAPILAGLVNRIAIERPVEVMSFMTAELEKYIANPEYFNDISPPQNTATTLPASPPKAEAPPTRPTTAPKTEVVNKQPVSEKNVQLAVVGLGGAGKSSILNMIQGKFETRVRPTVGFRPVSMMLSEETKVRFYDLGGGKKIREIWAQYYHDVHGVVYVIDGSTSTEEMESTVKLFADTVNHPFLAGKPLLVLVNKQDLENSLQPHDIDSVLRPHVKDAHTVVEFAGCSAWVPDPLPEDFQADPRMEASLLHLINNVLGDFGALNERVKSDTVKKTAEEVRQRVAKERKVLKNKIACAFINEANPEYVASMQIEAEPENVFSEEDGLVYLASEIGEDGNVLCQEAQEIASMVGYQKLALTIIGGLKAPVSKKKVPMDWAELYQMVATLREELGLQSQLLQ
jgi:ADP-ribosylation factor-like protein 13B